MNNRVDFIDMGKGAGIFLVVLGHFYMNTGQYNNPIAKVIYLFHMPLFFFLSGIVTKLVNEWCFYLHKKLIRLMIPFLVWFCFYLFLWKGSILSVFDEMKMGVWYLQALFFFYVAHCFYSYVSFKLNRKNTWALDFLIGIAFYFLFKIIYHVCMFAPFDLNGLLGNIHFVNFWPYFFLGVLLKKHLVVQKILEENRLYAFNLFVSITGIVIFFVLPIFPFVIKTLITFSVLLSILYCLNKIPGGQIKKILLYFGKHSLGIYVVHYIGLYFSLNIIEKVIIGDSHLMVLLIFLGLSFFLCFLSIFVEQLLSHNSFLSKVLFGIGQSKS